MHTGSDARSAPHTSGQPAEALRALHLSQWSKVDTWLEFNRSDIADLWCTRDSRNSRPPELIGIWTDRIVAQIKRLAARAQGEMP